MAQDIQRETYEAYARVWDSRTPNWKELLDQVVDDACVYSNMLINGQGLDGLGKAIEAFHLTNPESIFATTGYMEQHGKSLGNWDLRDAGGNVLMSGLNYTVYGKDRRMVQIAGFWKA